VLRYGIASRSRSLIFNGCLQISYGNTQAGNIGFLIANGLVYPLRDLVTFSYTLCSALQNEQAVLEEEQTTVFADERWSIDGMRFAQEWRERTCHLMCPGALSYNKAKHILVLGHARSGNANKPRRRRFRGCVAQRDVVADNISNFKLSPLAESCFSRSSPSKKPACPHISVPQRRPRSSNHEPAKITRFFGSLQLTSDSPSTQHRGCSVSSLCSLYRASPVSTPLARPRLCGKFGVVYAALVRESFNALSAYA
jgi:hypothetical protein